MQALLNHRIDAGVRKHYTLCCGGHSLKLGGRRTYIMGIVNVTPDSFSDGGRFVEPEEAAEHLLRLVSEGADIIDIGGESTRPGSRAISIKEEISRVQPLLKKLRGSLNIPISIDTSKSEVAEMAIGLGASIVNDVTALRGDKHMIEVIRRYDAGVVLMHMKGEPRTMQAAPRYADVVGDIIEFLGERIDYAVNAGIKRSKIIIDPGIGFGKTLRHNLLILKHLRRFEALKRPLLIGTSRKSFIGRILHKESRERLYGTVATCIEAVREGAHILRVHDVREVKEAVEVEEMISRV